jgi:hypothetical protein
MADEGPTLAVGIAQLLDIDIPLEIASSAFSGGAYNPKQEMLTLHFSDGSTYDYAVDPATLTAFVSAGNPGAFFHAFIRPRGQGPLGLVVT